MGLNVDTRDLDKIDLGYLALFGCIVAPAGHKVTPDEMMRTLWISPRTSD